MFFGLNIWTILKITASTTWRVSLQYAYVRIIRTLDSKSNSIHKLLTHIFFLQYRAFSVGKSYRLGEEFVT